MRPVFVSGNHPVFMFVASGVATPHVEPPFDDVIRPTSSTHVVSVQDTAGNPEKSQAGDKILALLQEQLK